MVTNPQMTPASTATVVTGPGGRRHLGVGAAEDVAVPAILGSKILEVLPREQSAVPHLP